VTVGKSWRVPLNDIFLALLLKALSPCAEGRVDAPRRKRIAVASIVNIRRNLGVDITGTFGLFLGSFVVFHPVPPEIRLEEIVRDIHGQTDKIKRDALYLRSVLELGLARLLFPLFSHERQKKFYPKYYPLWGGITNVNLNTLWRFEDEKDPTDYLRAVSTGPVSPLVFAITTVGEVVNIGVSFKTTVFSRTEINRIITDFSRSIDTLGMQA
jgi:NRPS condensation-like uncharacterized protein